MAVSLFVVVRGGGAVSSRVGYCAQMRDAVGLYPGNAVTRLGVPIGTVRSVTPQGGHVLVRFDVRRGEILPADVGIATVNDSIIAVRGLAVIGNDSGGPRQPAEQCIPLRRTRTPLSISESMDSIGQFGGDVLNASGPDGVRRLTTLMATLNKRLDGSGPGLNTMFKQLGGGDATVILPALGRLASVIDSMSSLSQGLADNWPMLQQFMTVAPPEIDGTFLPSMLRIQRIMNAGTPTMVLFEKLLPDLAPILWMALDAAVPLLRLTAAGVRTAREFVDTLPNLTNSLVAAVDQKNNALRVAYRPPMLRTPVADPAAACAVIVRAGVACRADGGKITTDLFSAFVGLGQAGTGQGGGR